MFGININSSPKSTKESKKEETTISSSSKSSRFMNKEKINGYNTFNIVPKSKNFKNNKLINVRSLSISSSSHSSDDQIKDKDETSSYASQFSGMSQIPDLDLY